jgi:hypothetical protein
MLHYLDLINRICEFYEIAFHLILFLREIYPATLFSDAQRYQTKVKVCRSPLVITYIKDLINSFRPDLEKVTVCSLFAPWRLPFHIQRGVKSFDFVFCGTPGKPSSDLISCSIQQSRSH